MKYFLQAYQENIDNSEVRRAQVQGLSMRDGRKVNMAVNIQEAIKDWVVSPPHVHIKLKETLEDPRSSFREFSGIIGNDPALTARLLKIVNSSFYGLESEVETITHALGIIGTE